MFHGTKFLPFSPERKERPKICQKNPETYRVIHHVVSNLPLTSKQEFSFGLARSGQARPKWNFFYDVNLRLETT